MPLARLGYTPPLFLGGMGRREDLWRLGDQAARDRERLLNEIFGVAGEVRRSAEADRRYERARQDQLFDYQQRRADAQADYRTQRSDAQADAKEDYARRNGFPSYDEMVQTLGDQTLRQYESAQKLTEARQVAEAQAQARVGGKRAELEMYQQAGVMPSYLRPTMQQPVNPQLAPAGMSDQELYQALPREMQRNWDAIKADRDELLGADLGTGTQTAFSDRDKQFALSELADREAAIRQRARSYMLANPPMPAWQKEIETNGGSITPLSNGGGIAHFMDNGKPSAQYIKPAEMPKQIFSDAEIQAINSGQMGPLGGFYANMGIKINPVTGELTKIVNGEPEPYGLTLADEMKAIRDTAADLSAEEVYRQARNNLRRAAGLPVLEDSPGAAETNQPDPMVATRAEADRLAQEADELGQQVKEIYEKSGPYSNQFMEANRKYIAARDKAIAARRKIGLMNAGNR